MVKLPYYIDPNPLIDTFVEVTFDTSSQNPLYIPGLLFVTCKNLGFELMGPHNDVFSQEFVDIKITYNLEQVFRSDELGVKLLIKNSSIVLNSLEGYQGWEKYNRGIRAVLSEILKIEALQPDKIKLKFVSRFDMPYWEISYLPNINLRNDFQKSRTASQEIYEFPEANIRASLMGIYNEETFESFIETESTAVFSLNRKTPEEIFSYIEKQHTILKQLFFSTLKEEYILTLNPKYQDVK